LAVSSGYFGELWASYVRGEAYLAAHDGVKASAEFQKIVDHPGIVLTSPVGVAARWKLGKALALSGDTAAAKRAYGDFFSLLEGGDAGIPIVREAKKEFERLPGDSVRSK